MSEPVSINDKAELEMARLSLRTHLRVALPIVLDRTRPFFRELTKHRAEQRWAMIEKLIDEQIARIDDPSYVFPADEASAPQRWPA